MLPLRALDAGWLSEAFLDVFAVEPLPPKSPLWTHPKVTVTPHVAGSHIEKMEGVSILRGQNENEH